MNRKWMVATRIKGFVSKAALFILTAWVGLQLPAAVFAQAVAPPAPVVPEPDVAVGAFLFSSPHFFTALIAGLILAFAFQLILTELSVAAGLNILGKTPAMKEKRIGPKTEQEAREKAEEESEGAGPATRKISSAFGVWALITATIALFFASWLSVGLSLTNSAAIGAILGLAIWGIFFILMTLLESSAVMSLVGGLVKFAAGGLRSAYQATTSLFQGGGEGKMSETLEKVAGKVREEVLGSEQGQDMKSMLQAAMDQAKTKEFSTEDFKRVMEVQLSDDEMVAVKTQEGIIPSVDTIQSLVPKEGKFPPEQSRSIAQGIQQVLTGFKEQPGQPSSSALAQEVQGYRDKFDTYLRTAAKGDLTADNIRRNLEKIMTEPKTGSPNQVRLAQITKATISATFSQRKDMNPDEVRKYADMADQKLGELKAKYPQPNQQAVRDSIQKKIALYMLTLSKLDLDFGKLRQQALNMLKDPKGSGQAFMAQLKSINAEDFKNQLSAQGNIPKEDIDHIIQNFESYRNDLMAKAEQMQHEIRVRVERAKTEALRQADEARKTAATAAWWVFATAAVSAIAAAIGGTLGVNIAP